MKVKHTLTRWALVLPAILFYSCDSSDDDPVRETIYTPVKMEAGDISVELQYNAAGELTHSVTRQQALNGVVLTSTLKYIYKNGRIDSAARDTGFRISFQYEDDKIVSAEEYIDVTWVQRHTFTYDTKGRLKESITWQNVPEEGGISPVQRNTFEYDERDNLIANDIYYYSTGKDDFVLLTVMRVSDYDNQPNAEGFFERHPYNPLVTLRKNNPRKMVITNAAGLGKAEYTFTYTYNAGGYPVKKDASVLFDGVTTTSEVRYFFTEE
jgi:hypothetical protein